MWRATDKTNTTIYAVDSAGLPSVSEHRPKGQTQLAVFCCLCARNE